MLFDNQKTRMSQTPSFLYPNNRSLVAADVLDLGGLALQTAQVIELRTAHLTTADDLDMINAGRMQRERALYADAVADAANREGFAAGAVAAETPENETETEAQAETATTK